MLKQTCIGNGRNKNFFFTFPFFSPDEVIVKINDISAAGYGLFCDQGVSNQDFPFIGGHIKFTKPPKPTDIITIERKLKYNRVIDYQETAKIQPSILNQDMNYFFESLKDIKSILDELNENYAEITDIQSLNDLKSRITAVTEQIDNFAEQIESIGDITTIQTNINNLSQSVSDLASAITTHTTNIGTNTNDIAALKGYDYVIESQLPTSSNNYTWYRKYKSGWVEQGGHSVGSLNGEKILTLPIVMSNKRYQFIATFSLNDNDNSPEASLAVRRQRNSVNDTTSTVAVLATYAINGASGYTGWDFDWEVKGFAA